MPRSVLWLSPCPTPPTVGEVAAGKGEEAIEERRGRGGVGGGARGESEKKGEGRTGSNEMERSDCIAGS